MSKPTSSRREFLAGKSAAQALGDALAGPPQELPAPKTVGAEPGSHLISVSREAMACLFEVVFDAATYRDGAEAAVEALGLVDALEAQLTVYRENSEVSEINRRAGAEAVVVEDQLFGLFMRASELYEATGGAFDITAGRLSKIWGFYRRQGQMPSAAEVTSALASVGGKHVALDPTAHTIRFLRPDLELNLGAIGKGYALDRVAAALSAGGIRDFLIHGGNSSVLARGQRIFDLGLPILDSQNEQNAQSKIQKPKSKTPPGWTVALRHPLKPEIRLVEFVLCNQALGTSGSGTQFFHHQGKRYGHILDPRTGWPADQVLSATVIAPTAEEADALSTAFYVLGVAEAKRFCTQRPDVSALLVTHAPAAGEIELHDCNLADHAWERLDHPRRSIAVP